MTDYLLDTNVVSELTKRRPHPAAVAWLGAEPSVFLSVLTLGELARGAGLLRDRDRERGDRLTTWIDRLRDEYSDRILDVDRTVAATWATLPTTRTLPVVDGLLVATAVAHDLTVATRNTKGFADTGVATFDPFARGDGSGR